ncbi:hypothetical protein pdam_00010860 [Pocillopora damicornis]|nr:hypothetical protein pdam_00010860 [Pocillopora damicornis]
MVPPAK